MKQGYLLIEAVVSLLLVALLSTLVLVWHSQLITRQQQIFHTLQALCLARTVVEKSLQGKRVKPSAHYQVAISKTHPISHYTHISVTVSHEDKELVSLTSGCYHE